MRKYVFWGIVLHFLALIPSQIKALKAVTVVPVADLVGTPLFRQENKKMSSTYQQLPIDDRAKGHACRRVHQIVFNELIDIIAQEGDEVQVRILNVFYKNSDHAKPQTTYWSLKKNFRPISQLKAHHLDLTKIPQPVNFTNVATSINDQPIITLAYPWSSAQSKQLFSAGTRFVYSPSSEKTDMYHAFAFDLHDFTIKNITIPKSLCIAQSDSATNKEKVEQFVHLLRKWAHLDNGFIPYVWGGCSFTTAARNPLFTEKTAEFYGRTTNYFELHDYHQPIKTGFDCAGMVSRAAQICGMPYFYKNTYTLAQNLKTIAPGSRLHDGDLIWLPGHVLVVGNRKNNTLIEARSFAHGYGKLQEISLARSFKGIDTFEQLETDFFAKKPLIRLDAHGSILAKIHNYQLLSIATIWQA